MKKIELTEKECNMLWNMCNSIQNNGIKFLMNYEVGLYDKSEVLKIWYDETKQEFKELQVLKEKLKNEKSI